ncbi:MAG: Asp-tRNA(Asn)/Glu-tRNA(Gln) amidotransferase subunit GatC [Caulobacteraceae bacterium]
MAIDPDTVRKVASLARIRIEEERLEPMARELSGIIAWVEQLAEVETSETAPMTTPVDVALPMREDVATEGGAADEILANAPRARRGYFVVPKVVE